MQRRRAPSFLSLFLMAATLLALSACGFTPMYGRLGDEGPSAQAALNEIEISTIPDQQGQAFRNLLIDQFYHDGRPADPKWLLKIAPVVVNKTELDLTKDSTATREQLSVSTSFSLIDKATGKSVLDRSLSSGASYDILDSRFTTRVSEDTAQQNALEDMARQTEQQILLYFRRADGGGTGAEPAPETPAKPAQTPPASAAPTPAVQTPAPLAEPAYTGPVTTHGKPILYAP